MREIVTIQVGNYANFVGSHFWNFQDELLGLSDSPEGDHVFRNHGLDMDVIYRSGETQQGVLTYTPRLVSIDFQGSLGTISSSGTLYNEFPKTPESTSAWAGPVTTVASQPLKKNLFLQSLSAAENEDDPLRSDNGNSISFSEIQDKEIVECLENEVQYWTDFSKVHYHPQSLYELSGLWTDYKHFNNYGIGKEAFSQGGHAESINDRLRFFLEECERPQGIQFVVDDSGGFTGVAGAFLEHIADEYTSIPILLYSARSPYSSLDPNSQKLSVLHKLHDAVSFSNLSSLCNLFVPLGLPSLNTSGATNYLSLEDHKPYHSSAIYAAALYSMSIPFRLEPPGPSAQFSYACGSVDMKELEQIIAGQGRRNMITILDVAMPAPAIAGNQSSQVLLKNLQSLSPEIADDVEDIQALESLCIHGVFTSESKRASISEIKDAVEAAYSQTAEKPKFSHLSAAQCPLPIPLPFPSIFGNHVGQHGEILGTPISGSTSRGSLEVHSIPMATRLRSSKAILPFIENRLENLNKLGIRRGASGMELLRNWGFGKEDVDDMGETLSSMAMKLNPFAAEDSDSD